MKGLLLSFTLLFLVGFSTAEDKQIKIAVFELIPQGVEQSAAGMITDRLRNELLSVNDLNCIERSQMQQIFKENGVQELDCSTNECAIKIGKLLEVSYAIVGKIGKIGEMYTLHLRIIEVETGKITFSVNKDCKGSIETVFTTTTREVVGDIANAIKKSRYSCLIISTAPPGATVLLNDKKMNSTPYKNEKIEAGTYDIKLKLNTYEIIQKTIELQMGEIEELTFDLSHTQQYLDSIKTLDSLKAVKIAQEKAAAIKATAEKEKKKKRFKLISRIALGSLTAGLIAGGYYMDMQVQDKMEEKEQIYDLCKSSLNQQQLDKYKADYDMAHNDGEDLGKYRTLLYVGAGVTAACFGVTFFF